MTSFFHLLGLLAVVDSGVHQSAELSQLLVKGGFAKTEISKAHAWLEEGEKLLTRALSVDENRIADHGVHTAGAELEMWSQTVKHILKNQLDADVLATAMGDKIHAHNHTLTIIAQSLRLLAMIRTDSRIQEAIGDERRIRDVGTRGWALIHRIVKSTEIRLQTSHPEGLVIAKEIDAFNSKVRAYLTQLDPAARKVGDAHLSLLGLLGHVPDGFGIPVGGTAFNVVLHEKGQGEVPNLADRKVTSGWSIGRQGRNKENLGKGWVEPTFS